MAFQRRARKRHEFILHRVGKQLRIVVVVVVVVVVVFISSQDRKYISYVTIFE